MVAQRFENFALLFRNFNNGKPINVNTNEIMMYTKTL